jgi:hypothetical protein
VGAARECGSPAVVSSGVGVLRRCVAQALIDGVLWKSRRACPELVERGRLKVTPTAPNYPRLSPRPRPQRHSNFRRSIAGLAGGARLEVEAEDSVPFCPPGRVPHVCAGVAGALHGLNKMGRSPFRCCLLPAEKPDALGSFPATNYNGRKKSQTPTVAKSGGTCCSLPLLQLFHQ